jgi:hypothetical protein
MISESTMRAAPRAVIRWGEVARYPPFPAGDYKLHWAVRTMAGADIIQGDIPFTVKDQP